MLTAVHAVSGRLQRRAQSGDTIVEIMIVIAIMGVVLAGAFVVTNKSLSGVRDSQEHEQSVKALESQVEQLRAAAVGGDTTPFSIGAFCVAAGVVKPFSASACTFDSTGVIATAASPQPTYTLKVTYSGASLFKVQATWVSVSGGSGGASMFYKVHQVTP